MFKFIWSGSYSKHSVKVVVRFNNINVSYLISTEVAASSRTFFSTVLRLGRNVGVLAWRPLILLPFEVTWLAAATTIACAHAHTHRMHHCLFKERWVCDCKSKRCLLDVNSTDSSNTICNSMLAVRANNGYITYCLNNSCVVTILRLRIKRTCIVH